jgi:predicted nucleic acid-binding protein
MLQLAGCTELVRPTETLDVIPNDPDDNRVLECAVTAGSQFIVTGDSDLLVPLHPNRESDRFHQAAAIALISPLELLGPFNNYQRFALYPFAPIRTFACGG